MAHTSPVRVLLNGSASPPSDAGQPPPSKPSPTPPPSPPPPSSPRPPRARREQPSMPLCEGCQSPHDASYGSGRFCSVHCARRVAASTKWQKQRMRARVKRLPSQKSSSRAPPSQCATHTTPFLLPANPTPIHYYRAPLPRVAYEAAFVPQLVPLAYADAQAMAVGVSTAPYQQQAQQLHQHMLPYASCLVPPYATVGASAQPSYAPSGAATSRARTHAHSRSSAAASATWPHQLLRYPSFKQCTNAVTNCARRNESHAVAEALLRLKSSRGNSS